MYKRQELAWLRRGAPARTSKPKFRIEAANELISDVPEIRDRIALQSLAVSRLGKDVVDLIDAGVTFPATGSAPEREVLRDVEWRIAPGERTGILGVNGAGKSTLLGLVAGTLSPTSGRVKHGKTCLLYTSSSARLIIRAPKDARIAVTVVGRTAAGESSDEDSVELWREIPREVPGHCADPDPYP